MNQYAEDFNRSNNILKLTIKARKFDVQFVNIDKFRVPFQCMKDI